MPLAAAAVALACRLSDPAITESSGVARGTADAAWLFTHNDSGDRARFFAVDRSCRTVGTWRVHNVTAVDWEDMAVGPGGTLWFGDIGDNSSRRDHVTLYRVDGSALPPGAPERRGADDQVVDATRVDLHYEDGPHDAETLLVHPVDGRTWVVTKSVDGDAGVYEARPDGVLHRIAELSLDLGGATGGDLSPDGRKVVIRAYAAAYEWRVVGNDLAASLTSGTGAATSLPMTEQGEGIAYLDDDTLVTTAEGVGSAVRTFASRIRAAPTTSTPPSVRPDDDSDLPWLWLALAVGGGGVVVALGALVVRARRRGE